MRRIKGGMPEVLRVARETSEDRGWFLGRQFANEDNTEAHRLNTPDLKFSSRFQEGLLMRLCQEWARGVPFAVFTRHFQAQDAP